MYIQVIKSLQQLKIMFLKLFSKAENVRKAFIKLKSIKLMLLELKSFKTL